ncbi:hypothetical protein V6N12_047037 [Hibiscus sabdariffa]|uniref:Diacylglycerol O-acyltransferase n=1 Tax=Hibiscus sabdariffa TaxID=183260 RepID=A0ABR2AT62_9ROSI
MEPAEVLSPGSLLFLEPKTSCCIIAMMGCKTSIDPAILKLGLNQTLLHHPRFSSKLLVINGVKKKWVKTQVDLDNHVVVPVVDTEMESPALFIEDYISHLTTIPIDFSKPLWELHILNLKTPEAEAFAIFRIHHSIGDGMSLISILLACCRKSADPGALPTLPTQKQTDDRGNRRKIVWLVLAVWSVLRLMSNTLVDLSLFMATILFMKDTKTPVKGLSGVEHNPKRFVHRTVRLDDIKLVKNAMDMTVNDVILGVTQAGEVDKSKSIPKNIRLRATVLVNIRQDAGIQAMADMMKKKSKAKWGNKFGFICVPFNIALQNDPLDYLRQAKAIVQRKKLSLQALCTYMTNNCVVRLFGSKVSSCLAYRVFSNTTMSISNVVGPVEEISFFGHPIAFIAPTVFGHPQALTIHFQSYVDKMSIVVAVDPSLISDPHLLCDDFQESLKLFKDAIVINDGVC